MRRLVAVTLLVAGACGLAFADVVAVNPAEPVAGGNVTITYDPSCRPLAGETAVSLRYGFNGWHPTVDPDPAMTLNAGLWEITVAVPTQATEMNVALHTGGDPDVWDNNDGWNWAFATTNGVPNTPAVQTSPSPVQANAPVTVTYTPAGGPLAGQPAIFLHYGFNNWNPTGASDVLMTTNGSGGYTASVPVKSYAGEFDVTFNNTGQPDNAGTLWDTNDGFDWRLPVTGTIPGVEISPNPPVAKQPVIVYFNPEDSPLNASTTGFVYLHWGINEFAQGYGPDILMTWNGTRWEATIPSVPVQGCTLAFVFNDGNPDEVARIWDNNSGNDWTYAVDGCKPFQTEAAGLYVARKTTAGGDFLAVGVAGNLEHNSSAMVVFIDTPDTPGQTELMVDGVAEPPTLLPLASKQIDILSCSAVGFGTKLPGEADYALYVNATSDRAYFNEYALRSGMVDVLTCCDGSTVDVLAAQIDVGSTLFNEIDENLDPPGTGPSGYRGGFNDTNTNGVPAAVTTGLEVLIPVEYIGDPPGLETDESFNVYVLLMPNNGGVQGQFSNQALPPADDPAASNGYCLPPGLFPLRADLQPFTSVYSVASYSGLPAYGGTADGTIDPANYGGTAVSLQTCPVPDAVADTTVSVDPTPAQGAQVTVYYDAAGGPLESAPSITLKYGFDGNLTTPTSVVMTQDPCAAATAWQATVTMSASALLFDLYFAYNTTVDDNNGQNWHYAITRAAGEAVEASPDPILAGGDVTVIYDPTGRPLEGAATVCVHKGFNTWSVGVGDVTMTLRTDCRWEATFPVSSLANGPQGLSLAFYDCGGLWDNNGGADWYFPVTPTGALPPWTTTDGQLDVCATQMASNAAGTRHLWAGFRDGWVYVATERAQSNNDQFIFVSSNGPVTMVGAPWAKSGTVGQYDGFLAQEVSNGWNGWQNGIEGLNGPQSTTNPYLEGQFRLSTQLPTLPTTIYVAIGSYGNANGGLLVPTLQAPPGNGDLNIDGAEYVATALGTIEVLPPFDLADFNTDCVVNINDYKLLEPCLSGPGGTPGGSCTTDADLDGDGDVDLKDFHVFQQHFGNEG